MARSIAAQSADNQRLREEARQQAEAKARKDNADAGLDKNAPLTPEQQKAIDDAASAADHPIVDQGETGTATPVGTGRTDESKPTYNSAGEIIGGDPSAVNKAIADRNAANAAANGKDAVGDSASARALRDQLLKERAALTPGQAPVVDGPNAMDAAYSTDAPQVVAPTVASTTQVAAGPVSASQIAPIERVTASQVDHTNGATAGGVNAATIDTTAQDQFRQDQRGLIGSYQDEISGKVPSAAQLGLKGSMDDAVAQQLGVVGLSHGRGAGAAMRQAGRNIAGIQQKQSLDAAILQANERTAAQSGLAGVLGTGREQDINLATKTADLKQGADTTTAQLKTQVEISNADRDAARAMKDADLKQAAATGNAAAQNELNRRQAELDSAANQRTQELALDAAKSNQGVEAAKSLSDADLDAKIKLANQDAALKVQLTNAGFNQQVILQTSAQELQRQLANAGFQLTQQQIDDLKQKNATDSSLTAQGQALAFDTASNQQDTQKEITRMQLQGQYDMAKQQNDQNMMNSILSAAATAGVALITAFSDKRMKKSIRKASDSDVDKFLGALEAWNYRYKDGANGEGQQSGPMAQELEKSAMGRGSVVTDERGRKGVDTNRLTLALAGAVARLAKRQRREGRAA